MVSSRNTTTIIFALNEQVGALAKTLEIFLRNGVNLLQIESHCSKQILGEYEFIVECDPSSGNLEAVMNGLKKRCTWVELVCTQEEEEQVSTPWFPQSITDLDDLPEKMRQSGAAELTPDVPGYGDSVYRQRRAELAEIAFNYNAGVKIPRVEYNSNEIATWGKIFGKLMTLYPTNACKEHLRVLPDLIEKCGYREDNIPQLQDISDFLEERTGFTLRPACGLLTSRDFFASLAHRIFHATQFVRHHSHPFYTPEPDACHELLGHVPLLADPTFAEFSQQIGLASLGASDVEIERLATCYWFTVEFGLCLEDGEIKAYGAGLLSSYGELEHCRAGKSELRPFEPEVTALQEYPLNGFQPVYFVAESIYDATVKLRKYAETHVQRPFSLTYNRNTKSVEITKKLNRLQNSLQMTECWEE